MNRTARRCFALALMGLMACEAADAPPVQPPPPTLHIDPATDPVGAAAEIDALPDPIQRVAAVNGLADGGAPITRALCIALKDPSAQARCERFATRPHLTEEAMSQPERGRGRPASGPPAGLLAPLEGVASTLATALPKEDRCASGDDAYHRKEAALVARRGQAAEAAGHCAAIADLRWSQECRFEAAEAAARQRGAAGQRDMAELCLGTGGFQARCFHHGARLLATAAPDAASPAAEWDRMRAASASMKTFWSKRDPEFGRWQQDRLWSYGLWQAMAHTEIPGAGALAELPAEAAPHIRQALAFRILEEAPMAASLSEMVLALNEALVLIPPVQRSMDRVARVHPMAPLWPSDRGPEDAAIPATFCLGSSRRALSADPAVDGRIVLLEAAARQVPPRRNLLEEGRLDSDPIVKWTALRLLEGGPAPQAGEEGSPPPLAPRPGRGG